MEDVIRILLNKKELRGINKEIVQEIINNYKEIEPQKYEFLKQKNFNPKSKEYEDFKKFVRKKLRNLHGVFQKNKQSKKKQEEYIKNKEFDFFSKNTLKFLKSHRSTKERLNHYETLYVEIQKHTGKIKSLADLGCGLNPLSYSLLKDLQEVFCVDINDEEIRFIQDYLDVNKLNGEAKTLDLTKIRNLEEINKKTQNCAVCFLFKTLDGLEAIRKGASKELVKNINSDFIIISFSTKTISGKNKINAERKWFQDILKEQNSQNNKIIKKTIGNEEYYVVFRK